jgi:8-oxo-dGTP diphosphatase
LHVVAVSALIRNAAGEILMIEHPRRGWEIPGGRVEEGEDLLVALEREILEETGAKAEIGRLAGVYSHLTPPSMLLLAFLAEYHSGELVTSEESVAVEWVKPEQVVPRISNPAIRDRVQDLLAFEGKTTYGCYYVNPYRISERGYV